LEDLWDISEGKGRETSLWKGIPALRLEELSDPRGRANGRRDRKRRKEDTPLLLSSLWPLTGRKTLSGTLSFSHWKEEEL